MLLLCWAPKAPAIFCSLAPEERIATTLAELRSRPEGAALLEVITVIMMTRFQGRSIEELCATTGLSLEDFRLSVVYREISGTGRAEGESEQVLRQLRRRCGTISAFEEATIRALPVKRLEALADALLDFRGSEDLNAWLAKHG